MTQDQKDIAFDAYLKVYGREPESISYYNRTVIVHYGTNEHEFTCDEFTDLCQNHIDQSKKGE